MPVTFTIDLEDPTESYAPDGRYAAMTHELLELCALYRCQATFFAVGKLARANPRLIQAIAAKGHEIAYHSRAHVPLTEEVSERFAREAREDKDFMEQLTGHRVSGFRAPRFSLTPKSRWAVDTLGELGFLYSSSIMPTSVSLYGYPGAPRTAFKWANGLIELPLPVADVLGRRIPYLGGIYLYSLPFAFTRRLAKEADPREVLWTYTHPYDFDRHEKFHAMPHTATWISLILWLSRRWASTKVRKALMLGKGKTLAECAKEITDFPIFGG